MFDFRSGGEDILLVEDDLHLRKMAAEVLSRHGIQGPDCHPVQTRCKSRRNTGALWMSF